MEPKHWMAAAFGKHPGKLHRELHVKQGMPIPAGKLDKAEHSKDPALRRRAILAETGKRLAGHKKG